MDVVAPEVALSVEVVSDAAMALTEDAEAEAAVDTLFSGAAMQAELDAAESEVYRSAEEAIVHARKSLPQKAVNKFYGTDESIIPGRKMGRYGEQARQTRMRWLKKIRVETKAEKAVGREKGRSDMFRSLAKICYTYGENACGNCEEYAYVAYDYLSDQLASDCPLDIVHLEAPGDHVFVAINQLRNADGLYPMEFKDWDRGSYIVDAWANIACPAQNYPEEWAKRMHKWAARKLTIRGESPLSDKWLNALTTYNKLPV